VFNLLRVNWGEKKVEFVICDDEKLFRSSISKIIDKTLINNDDDYTITTFSKFDKSFENKINEKKSKIYILDIEIKDSISGIDIARKIRKDDWDSIIIFVTSHNELGYQALKAQIMLLDFISKYDNFENNFVLTIKKAISLINSKKAIKFDVDGISYIIHLNDILYIEKDTVDRKCIIKTTYTEIAVNKTLNYMIENLDDRFYLCHRSCLVNTEKIRKVDWKNSSIFFDNGEVINLLSRDKKKGLRKYVNS